MEKRAREEATALTVQKAVTSVLSTARGILGGRAVDTSLAPGHTAHEAEGGQLRPMHVRPCQPRGTRCMHTTWAGRLPGSPRLPAHCSRRGAAAPPPQRRVGQGGKRQELKAGASSCCRNGHNARKRSQGPDQPLKTEAASQLPGPGGGARKSAQARPARVPQPFLSSPLIAWAPALATGPEWGR